MKDKKAIVGQGYGYPRMGGQRTGADVVRKAFGEAEELMTSEPVASPAEADSRAKARLAAIGLGLVREGVCPGRTDLRAGKVIEIKGIGKRFSGPYYVTAASHHLGAGAEGYSTRFTVWRNST